MVENPATVAAEAVANARPDLDPDANRTSVWHTLVPALRYRRTAMSSHDQDEPPLTRALGHLWRAPRPARRSGGLSVDRIVAAAIELADADGLTALSMAKLAQRLGCGTMSLYRHVSNKDELVTFMLSSVAGPPPVPARDANWSDALTVWANGLWDVLLRHPWILQTASSGPPTDPGQLSWLDAGLAALATTGLTEQDKLRAVMAVLHYVRGAAALATEAGSIPEPSYAGLLGRLVDAQRFPALAAALDAGAFDGASGDPLTEFHSGLRQLIDGVAVRVVGR